MNKIAPKTACKFSTLCTLTKPPSFKQTGLAVFPANHFHYTNPHDVF
ncbi:hypothetical protein [Vibrio hepatarius]|nr:hypothetical protein [Vibrio hepatarius]NIY84269.1 hypothetical protein [Vibrio hepatarius]